MKLIKYLLFFCLFFATSASVSRATYLELGIYPPQFLDEKTAGDLTLKIRDSNYPLSKLEIKKWFKENTDLNYLPSYRSEIENIRFCQYKKSLICRLTLDSNKKYNIQKVSLLALNKDLVQKLVEDLARQSGADPQDAKLKFENGKVSAFSLSEKGIKLDQEKSLEIITSYFKTENNSSEITLPYSEIAPAVSINSIDNMGITSLIGEGRSNFRGSPKNRIFNINVASNRFNGILIKPGEEFSFVKVLGEVDAEHGYLPELVIKRDKTEPEFGGGICQVSTTAFRAAIYSGLKITARRNHAYPVSYYNPQGMDATVYIPRPDLRFINNTPAYILIQTGIEGTELVFDFYGTDDGRQTTVIGPTITERNPDGSMKATFTQEVKDKDGNIIRDDVFNSNYDSPSKYPHPGQETILTKKPSGWSDSEWKDYKKAHHL